MATAAVTGWKVSFESSVQVHPAAFAQQNAKLATATPFQTRNTKLRRVRSSVPSLLKVDPVDNGAGWMINGTQLYQVIVLKCTVFIMSNVFTIEANILFHHKTENLSDKIPRNTKYTLSFLVFFFFFMSVLVWGSNKERNSQVISVIVLPVCWIYNPFLIWQKMAGRNEERGGRFLSERGRMTVPLPESRRCFMQSNKKTFFFPPNECLSILKTYHFEPSAVRALIDQTLKSQSQFSLIKARKDLCVIFRLHSHEVAAEPSQCI